MPDCPLHSEDHDPGPRPFAELRNEGLLWLLNRRTFHPNGYALAMYFDDAGNAIGWGLLGDGLEPWVFDPATDEENAAKLERYFGHPVASTGVGLIAAERERQVSGEGWSAEHDAEHDDAALAWAARCYIDAATIPDDQWEWMTAPPMNWPWTPEDWKPSHGTDQIRDLVKAGALIAAEIDRRLREAPSA